jgi:hypothetical protein
MVLEMIRLGRLIRLKRAKVACQRKSTMDKKQRTLTLNSGRFFRMEG